MSSQTAPGDSQDRPWNINQDLLDPYTLVHALAGWSFAKLGISFSWTVLSAVAWEIVEPWLKQKYPDQFPNPSRDAGFNKFTDIGAMLLGWSLGNE